MTGREEEKRKESNGAHERSLQTMTDQPERTRENERRDRGEREER